MKISQKKNCGACRVFSPVDKCCTIGYSTRYKYFGGKSGGMILDAIPTEPCPKPLTVQESVDAYKYYTKIK